MYNPINTLSNKVFIVVNSFGRGGAEMSLAILAFELANKGFSVYYISLWDEEEKYNFDWLKEGGVHVITLSSNKDSIFKYVYNFYKLVNTHRPLFIYSAMLKADFLSRIIASICKIDNASSIRNNPINYYKNNKLKLAIFFVLQGFQKNIVFLSNKAKLDFLNTSNSKFCRAKIFTLHNPIDLDQSFTKEMLKHKLDSFVIKCNDFAKNKNTNFKLAIVSRLVPGKGILELLSNIKNELSKFNFCLEIYGDGPLEGAISNFVIDSNLQNKIVFKGFVSNKIEIFSKVDILIFPSESEGFGRVPFESILMGNMVLCNKKVSIIDEFLPIPLLWTNFEYPLSISNLILNAVNLNVDESLEKIKKLSFSLSPTCHSDNFIEIMNECISI
jgi:glycosyltransferase involved in cell wall biosynthesis